MFHAGDALLAALGTRPSLVELLGLLSLDGLIKFGRGKLADFMAQFFDLIPGQFHWRAIFAISFCICSRTSGENRERRFFTASDMIESFLDHGASPT